MFSGGRDIQLTAFSEKQSMIKKNSEEESIEEIMQESILEFYSMNLQTKRAFRAPSTITEKNLVKAGIQEM